MDTPTQDLRYTLRGLRRNPGFALVAVLTLALGIGVNAAIFSLVNVVLFSELPMSDRETLVFLWSTHSQLGEDAAPTSQADFLSWREQAHSFSGLSALTMGSYSLTGPIEPMRVDAIRATANTFDVWGIEPLLGRGFLPGEDRPGGERVVILSHGFWQRQLGGAPGLVGSTLALDREEHTVVGVMGPELEFGDFSEYEIWVPLILDPAAGGRDRRDLAIVTGRLRPGVSLQQADEEMAVIGRRLAETYPETNRGWGARAGALEENLFGGNTRLLVTLLSLMVGFVLLIACANVASMLLARATARSKEMSVRVAMGASRGRLLRQLLTEGLVIALLAAGVGLLLAELLLDVLATVAHRSTFVRMVEIDGNVLLFTLLLAISTPLIFGLLPALKASRPDIQQTLRDAASVSGGRRGLRFRGLLVALQLAMALILMVVAALVTRSAISYQRYELGFEPRGVLSLVVDLPEAVYDEPRAHRFFSELVRRVEGLPGVQRAAVASHRPLLPTAPKVRLAIAGRAAVEDWERPQAFLFSVDAGYFDTLRIPLLRGRLPSPADTADSTPVAVISEGAARQLWGRQDPLGQRLAIGEVADGTPWIEIVGIVGDVARLQRSEIHTPQIYLPFDQRPSHRMALVARTQGDPTLLASAIRQQVWDLDPLQPVDDVRTMAQIHRDQLAPSYTVVMLFGVFAAFALFMSTVGLYSLMSYAVGLRRQEIGLRIALGARKGDVARTILRPGLRQIAFGVTVGTAGAWLVSRLLEGIVFGVSITDPSTFVGVALLLTAVALLAHLVPVRRAMGIDPMVFWHGYESVAHSNGLLDRWGWAKNLRRRRRFLGR